MDTWFINYHIDASTPAAALFQSSLANTGKRSAHSKICNNKTAVTYVISIDLNFNAQNIYCNILILFVFYLFIFFITKKC